MDANVIYSAVQRHYANAVQSCDRDNSERIAKLFGYTAAELESIPQDANLGLSCGNPQALANLKEVRFAGGEVASSCSMKHEARIRI